jgi:hypothetical protein
MTWQPIATAPKDQRVLLYYPQRLFGVVCGSWQSEEYARKPRPHWSNDRSHVHGVMATREIQPTHWMALPNAPDHDNPGWSDPLQAEKSP